MTPVEHHMQIEPIGAAKELFWRNGFDETSVEELVQATGLNRYALYNVYGGKLELFLEVLEAYHIERKTLFLNVLGDPERGPLDAIREVSEFCIAEMAERGAGCLMCNVALEVARYDDIVAEHVHSYLEEIRMSQEIALTQAAERGELNPKITPKEGAALLVSNMLGGGALACNGASKVDLLKNFNTIMTLLSQTAGGLRKTKTPDNRKGHRQKVKRMAARRPGV